MSHNIANKNVGMLAAIITIPVFRAPFGTFLLTAEDWAIAIGSASTVVPVIELLQVIRLLSKFRPRVTTIFSIWLL